jgi:hypothetical protein
LVRPVKRARHFGLPVFEKDNSMPNLICRASTDDRDVFGSRQQAAIEHLNIPSYPTALAKASCF